MTSERIDAASRRIRAPAHAIFAALMSAEAWLVWLPPAGMTARIGRFEPWPGGRYRLTLTYESPGGAGRGKTSADSDVVNGIFVELVPDRHIVQEVRFDSRDPAFAGVMRMCWIRSSLENLAAFVERGQR